MSRLLVLLNRLKAEARAERLTDTQLKTWENIWLKLKFPERVNLYGPAGSGKTFVAWATVHEKNAVYFGSPCHLAESQHYNNASRVVVVDNCNEDAGEMRKLFAEFQLRSIRSAVIITREPNQSGLPQVHLPSPVQQDIAVVYRNLSLLEHYTLSPRYEVNLWQIIYSTLE